MSYAKTSVVGLALALLLATAPQAFAAETIWPLQAPAAVLLAYGDAYAGRTHSGLDLAASAGTRVAAPVSARVAFAGNVPAAGGGTCIAITLSMADGRSITLMPLVAAEVTAGNEIAAGAALGEVAPGGDGSCPESHLHVGLKRGSTYLDPMTLLVAPCAAVSEPQPGGATTADAPVVAGTAQAPPAMAPAPAIAPAATPAGAQVCPDAPGVPAAGTAEVSGAAASSVAHAPASAPAHTRVGQPTQTTAASAAQSSLSAAKVEVAAQPTAEPFDDAHPTAPANMPVGVSLAAPASPARTRAVAPVGTKRPASADAEYGRTRAAVWDSARSVLAGSLDVARTVAVELVLVALGIVGASVRRRPLLTSSPASVRPVDQAIAAAADRCYTRRAHFLLRAQPSQSRSRLVQRR